MSIGIYGSVGTVEVSGGIVSVSDTLLLGYNSGAGTVTVDGGLLSASHVDDGCGGGTGTINVTSGTLSTVNELLVGDSSPGAGTLTEPAAGSTLAAVLGSESALVVSAS